MYQNAAIQGHLWTHKYKKKTRSIFAGYADAKMSSFCSVTDKDNDFFFSIKGISDVSSNKE